MPFRFTEQHIQDFHQLGYTVFKRILPTSLIRDLRKETDKARVIAREAKSENVQRLQPVANYDLNQKPFQDYSELPVLVDAVQSLLTKNHKVGSLDRLGIFFEPAEVPWCTPWHRDFRDHMPPKVFEAEFKDEWYEQMFDLNFQNQINCALYEDTSTWFVPGSHYRVEAIHGEMEARENLPDEKINNPKLAKLSYEDRERLCLDYASGMPGAVNLFLEPGDFCLYRPNAWHLGNYVPHRKRATLHDTPWTKEFFKYVATRSERVKTTKEKLEKASA